MDKLDDIAREEIEVLFYLRSEQSYAVAESRLDQIGAIVIELHPHLIEARLPEADIAGIVQEGVEAYTRKTGIPRNVLDSMPFEVKAYAQAFITPPLPKRTPNEGMPWNSKGFDAP